ncbi:MAG: putative tricarboxylic transport membrane protein, partial [Psychromonas sp.]
MKLNSASLLCRDRVGGLIFLIFCLTYGYQTSLIPSYPGDA